MTRTAFFKIYAVWMKEKKQWLAYSPVVSELAVRADTLEHLEHRLSEIIPELAEREGITGEAALILNAAL